MTGAVAVVVEVREASVVATAAFNMSHKQIYYSDKYFDENYEYR